VGWHIRRGGLLIGPGMRRGFVVGGSTARVGFVGCVVVEGSIPAVYKMLKGEVGEGRIAVGCRAGVARNLVVGIGVVRIVVVGVEGDGFRVRRRSSFLLRYCCGRLCWRRAWGCVRSRGVGCSGVVGRVGRSIVGFRSVPWWWWVCPEDWID
jgi:hypothetical protein